MQTSFKIRFFPVNLQLDFLSEAEMMKRFDHENIVKLLGVCTRGEPAYTIMEFMLHGNCNLSTTIQLIIEKADPEAW